MRFVLSALAPDVGGMTKECRAFAYFHPKLVKNVNAGTVWGPDASDFKTGGLLVQRDRALFSQTSNHVMCAEAVRSTHPPQRVIWLSEEPEPITGGGRRDRTLADGD